MHIVLIPALMGAGFLIGKMLRKPKVNPSRVQSRNDNLLEVDFKPISIWDTSKPTGPEPELLT